MVIFVSIFTYYFVICYSQEENSEGENGEDSAEVKENVANCDCENKLGVQDESNDFKMNWLRLKISWQM